MAPPERREHYASGTDYTVVTIDGQTYGLAICKDMHFAALGRAYGLRHAAVMLVPAWDFAYLDGWLEARTTVLRGIENGYTIVRASREGLLTASDPYGRILAEVPSSDCPAAPCWQRSRWPTHCPPSTPASATCSAGFVSPPRSCSTHSAAPRDAKFTRIRCTEDRRLSLWCREGGRTLRAHLF